MQRIRRPLVVLAAVLAACLIPPSSALAQAPARTEEAMVGALLKLKARQQAATKTLAAFHDFRFEDRYTESGILFTNQIVEDAGKNYKPIHYDHGTGLAAADVDDDGKTDLLFVNQVGGNSLWRGLGAGKFENMTDKAGIALANRVGVGAVFGDLDNDGDPDLVVTTVRGGNVLFENNGQGAFKDISAAAGLVSKGHSSGIVLFDYDNDGLLDIFICNVGKYTTDSEARENYFVGMKNAFSGHLFPERFESSQLFHNDGHMKFHEVTKEQGLDGRSWTGDAAFADVDGDGFPDLYLLNMQGDDVFYLNRGGKKFEQATAKYFPKTPWGAMGIKFFDFNNDGLIDLYVTDMHSDMTGSQSRLRGIFNPAVDKAKSEPWCTTDWTEAYLQGSSNNLFGNALYQKLPDGSFAEVSDQVGAETYWPWGVSVGDVNADGFEDVFVTAGMGYPFPYSHNSLLLNDAGRRFYDSEFILGIEPRTGNRITKEYFVLDASGADRTNDLAKGKTGKVPISGTLSSRSSVLYDFDDDGDLDLVTLELCDHPMVLRNTLSDHTAVHFSKIKLVGSKSNRDGIGAVVKLTAGKSVMTRVHDGKSGYLAQSSLPLYFGLGAATKIDRIEIKWPSGATQVLTESIGANQLLVIKEP